MDKIFALLVEGNEVYGRNKQELTAVLDSSDSNLSILPKAIIKAIKLDQLTGDEIEDMIRSQKAFKAYVRLEDSQPLGVNLLDLPENYVSILEVGGVYLGTPPIVDGVTVLPQKLLLVGQNPIGDHYGLEVNCSEGFLTERFSKDQILQAFEN